MLAPDTHGPDCSCGTPELHTLTTKTTADGTTVLFWNDGSVTGRMGVGLLAGAPKLPENLPTFITASWLAAGEVSLYHHQEVRRLVQVARRAVNQKQEAPLKYLRRWMAKN